MPMLKEECIKEERINGEVFDMSPSPHFNHGIVNGNINRIIGNGLKGSLCLSFMENLDYKYQSSINDDYVIPDVMIVCDRKHLSGGSYTGVPKFIVETLSPGTAMRDMTVKKDIYEKCGVEEYWIVSSREKAVEIYYLKEHGYELVNSYILDEDEKSKYYNVNTMIILRGFSHISMELSEIFEGVE